MNLGQSLDMFKYKDSVTQKLIRVVEYVTTQVVGVRSLVLSQFSFVVLFICNIHWSVMVSASNGRRRTMKESDRVFRALKS
jgi:hypothetical protein